MPAYRVYVITNEGRISQAPHIIVDADDQEAIGKASEFAHGVAVELWEGARFIVRLPGDQT